MAAMLFYIPLKLHNFGRSVRPYNTKFQEYILTHGSHIWSLRGCHFCSIW